MKIFVVLVWALLLGTSGRAQSVTLQGVATDSKGRAVRLEVNDTLRRLWRTVPEQPPISTAQKQLEQAVALQAEALINAGRYVLTTDSLGRFSINVNLQDSLRFSAYGHLPQVLAVRELLRLPSIKIKLAPEPCQDYVPCNESDATATHYVFIGRKKAIGYAQQPNYCDFVSMDSKFAAHYRVMENVYNTLPDTTLKFIAYDHYGWPHFSYHETVLLFVSHYCGEYIHQKYQYYPLYRTADGRWAAPVMADDLKYSTTRAALRPKKMSFATPVEVDIAGWEPEQRDQYYPAPYYRIEGQKAVAVYGNYVDELLEIKKRTVLKAREIKLN